MEEMQVLHVCAQVQIHKWIRGKLFFEHVFVCLGTCFLQLLVAACKCMYCEYRRWGGWLQRPAPHIIIRIIHEEKSGRRASLPCVAKNPPKSSLEFSEQTMVVVGWGCCAIVPIMSTSNPADSPGQKLGKRKSGEYLF